MAEVLAAIQATTALVEQACRFFGRLRQANDRQKGLPEVLARHRSELDSIKAIVGMIEDVDDLQTPSVAKQLVRLEAISRKLAALIKTIDVTTTKKMFQFARQLVDGSADERRLNDIMGELDQVKATLLLSIKVAHVGVIQTMDKRVVANAEAVERIDESLRELVQDWKGLRIARLLKGRRASNDGHVPLTLADLKALDKEVRADGEDSEDETLVDELETSPREAAIKTERIVINNASRGYAVQVNAPLDTDMYKDLSSLRIQDNVAEEQSVQINYGTTTKSLSILLELARLRQVSAPVIAR